ncbi:hypothetical protein [Comamonas koreensis]|uniref:hypothetical protein n=1 Tax=Comamonas koreensis TaxID=160825 RepID=UPI0015FBD95A|nr:hypothetical protein [Comamonas koreensis]
MTMWKYVVALMVPGVMASASLAQVQSGATDSAASAEVTTAQATPCDGAVMYALDNWYQVQRCESAGFLLPEDIAQSSADFLAAHQGIEQDVRSQSPRAQQALAFAGTSPWDWNDPGNRSTLENLCRDTLQSQKRMVTEPSWRESLSCAR